MSFGHPLLLLTFLVLPATVALYVVLERRPMRYAIACPERLIIATGVAPSALRPIVFPSRTALPSVNRTVPKSSSGMIPRPELGASWTHSADERDES